jgi:antitoxin VapB
MGKHWAHGLFEHGELVAVVIASDLIAPTCAGKTRAEAVELARLCASRKDLCRVMLRLWREMVLPWIARKHGYSVAVSYQDAKLHSGNTYRFDGWKKIGASRSGTDKRSGRKGRSKVIWAWHLKEQQ